MWDSNAHQLLYSPPLQPLWPSTPLLWKMMNAFPASSFLLTVPSRFYHHLRRRRFGLSFILSPGYTPFVRRCFCTGSPPLGTLLLALDSGVSPSVCRAVHGIVVKSRFLSEGFIGDRLVSAYLRFGFEGDALKLFDEMPQRDLVSWNSLISGFSRRGELAKCLSVFCRMRRDHVVVEPNEVTLISIVSACTETGAFFHGKSVHVLAVKTGQVGNTKVGNSLINMYGKFGVVDAACLLFDSMTSRSLVSWNSMLNINAQNGVSGEVIPLFNSMRSDGFEPDQVSIVSLFQGFTDLGMVKPIEVIHGYIVKYGFTGNVLSMSSLLSSYTKSGQLAASRMIFEEISDPDGVAWTAMLASYAIHGHGRGAVELFKAMVEAGIGPDHVTFVHLLNACSHSGFVEEGKKLFKDMTRIYGIEPRLEHYSCMVDLLGRSGLLNEADKLMETMPIKPNAGIWGALLGACRLHKNVELGQKAAENLIELCPSDQRNYIMLSNVYSACGQWADASKVRHLMKQRNPTMMSSPGYSLLEHGNRVHKFVVADQSHPEFIKIHEKLEDVMKRIREAGFVPQTEFVLHDVDEDVKEDMISKHSEKLAIAFGLLVTKPGTPMTIIKNLRICGDCHTMAKFVSQIEKRRIVIRDPKRFHHFTDGVCSCGDYW